MALIPRPDSADEGFVSTLTESRAGSGLAQGWVAEQSTLILSDDGVVTAMPDVAIDG